MARQAAHRGYRAICVEQIGYGERGERDLPKKSPDRTIDVAVHAVLLGQSLQGLKTMDVSAAIDWLESPESPFEIDRDRIFLFGHSSGGTTAQYAAALDPRIKGPFSASGSVRRVRASGPCVGSVRRVREIMATRGNANGEHAIPGFLTQFEFGRYRRTCHASVVYRLIRQQRSHIPVRRGRTSRRRGTAGLRRIKRHGKINGGARASRPSLLCGRKLGRLKAVIDPKCWDDTA